MVARAMRVRWRHHPARSRPPSIDRPAKNFEGEVGDQRAGAAVAARRRTEPAARCDAEHDDRVGGEKGGPGDCFFSSARMTVRSSASCEAAGSQLVRLTEHDAPWQSGSQRRQRARVTTSTVFLSRGGGGDFALFEVDVSPSREIGASEGTDASGAASARIVSATPGRLGRVIERRDAVDGRTHRRASPEDSRCGRRRPTAARRRCRAARARR